MTFEIELQPGYGGPYYVEAADAEDAVRAGIAAYRKRNTAVVFTPTDAVIKSVSLCDKTAVQYT